MKCRGYRYGVQWIATNDEPEEGGRDEMAGLLSVALLADLFGVDPNKVASDIIAFRQREKLREG